MDKVLKKVKLRLFRQGQTVFYEGNEHIVETVFVCGWDVYLKLSYIHDRVRADKVESEPIDIHYYGNE